MMSLKEGILCINTEIFNFNFFNIELLWTISTTIHKCIASAFSIHWDILHLCANDSNCLYGKVPLREHLNAFVTISNSSVAAGNEEKEPEPCEQAAAVGNQSHVLHGCSLRTHVLEQEARSQLQPMFKKNKKCQQNPTELMLGGGGVRVLESWKALLLIFITTELCNFRCLEALGLCSHHN